VLSGARTHSESIFSGGSRRKQEGLPPKKAILATAHKLIRVIFAMLSNKTLFRKGVAAE